MLGGMAKITFLGTGLIGGALAEAAAKRGDEVVAFNRTIEKARALGELGIQIKSSAAEAVRGSERVHIALSDDAAVDAVLASCAGELAGAVVIDHSTALPAGTVERARRLTEQGIAFLHAPVFMSPAMCREARGLMLVAGAGSTFERVAPALRAMTGAVEYLGERADLAAAYKLFGNAMILTITAGLADVYALATALGIPATAAQALFTRFNPAGTITYRGAAMAAGDYSASFELTMARKDARLMIETAAQAGQPLGVLPAIAQRMDELIARGHGAADMGVLAIDAVPQTNQTSQPNQPNQTIRAAPGPKGS